MYAHAGMYINISTHKHVSPSLPLPVSLCPLTLANPHTQPPAEKHIAFLMLYGTRSLSCANAYTTYAKMISQRFTQCVTEEADILYTN